MKYRIYIDTAVIGGCLDREFAEWSNLLMDEFRLGIKKAVLSDIVLREIEQASEKISRALKEILEDIGDIEEITENPEVKALASEYLASGAVPEQFEADALHIAMATVYRVDFLVSWNFKHIVNVNRIRAYNAVNMKLGYPLIEIRSPREVLNEK